MKKLYAFLLFIAINSISFGQLVTTQLTLFQTNVPSNTKKSHHPKDKTVNNDIVASEAFYGFGNKLIPYSRIPITQISPAHFSIKATNIGLIDQTNTIVTANISGTSFNGTSAPIRNIVGTTDSLIITPQWTPPNLLRDSSYNITLTIKSDSIDATPLDNSVNLPPIEITYSDGGYAIDDFGAPTGNGGGHNTIGTTTTEEYEAGNFFEIFNDQLLGIIDVVVGTNTSPGAILDVVLYEFSNDSFHFIERSHAYEVRLADIGNTVSLNLPCRPILWAGNSYFAAVHGWESHGGLIPEFFYGTSGTSPDTSSLSGATSLIFYPNMTDPNIGENYFTTQTPMVRLNFDIGFGSSTPCNTSIDELTNKIKLKAYPNPSHSIFNVVLQSKVTEKTNLIVKNSLGQTILNRTIKVTNQTKETIDLNNHSKGIYFLTVQNKTIKLIVK